jgi:hypothetical protein
MILLRMLSFIEAKFGQIVDRNRSVPTHFQHNSLTYNQSITHITKSSSNSTQRVITEGNKVKGKELMPQCVKVDKSSIREEKGLKIGRCGNKCMQTVFRLYY